MNAVRTLVIAISLALVAPAHAAADAAEEKKSAYKRLTERGESYTPEGDKIEKAEAKFPKATRQEPVRKPGSKIASEFNKLVEASNDKKTEETLVLAEKVIANPKASDYERSIAAQVAAYAWLDKETGNYTNAIRYLQDVLRYNGLDNNNHYEMLYQIAQMQLSDDDYKSSLESIDRFLAETQADLPKAHALRGNALYRLDRYAEAVDAFNKALAGEPNPDKSWNQMLMASYFELDKPLEAARIAEQIAAKDPNDKAAQLNLASIYLQADQPAKAGQVYDRLRAAGMLTEAKDYENGYRLLANIDGREKDAVELINEGLSKNILQPSFEIYSFLGQANYFADNIPQAIAAWEKAAPLDKDGETYLNLSKVLSQEEGRAKDAKANAQQALAKGVKKPGEAWMVVARAEYDLDNRAGVAAAYREAAKYPETREQATRALKQMGGK
jgi:tetratricopeptide (TPR) repeat protein